MQKLETIAERVASLKEEGLPYYSFPGMPGEGCFDDAKVEVTRNLKLNNVSDTITSEYSIPATRLQGSNCAVREKYRSIEYVNPFNSFCGSIAGKVFSIEDYLPFTEGKSGSRLDTNYLKVEIIYDALANTTHCFVVLDKESIERQIKGEQKSAKKLKK